MTRSTRPTRPTGWIDLLARGSRAVWQLHPRATLALALVCALAIVTLLRCGERPGAAGQNWLATDTRIVARSSGYAVLVLERRRLDEAGRLVLVELDRQLAPRGKARVLLRDVSSFDAARAGPRRSLGILWSAGDATLRFGVLAAGSSTIAEGAAPIDQRSWSPRVRWSGGDFALAWIADEAVRAARATADGALRGEPRTLAGCAGSHLTGYLGLAAHDDELLVSYATYDIYPYGPAAYDADLDLVHVVGTEITRIHVGTRRNTPTFGDSSLAHAGDGSWLVAWELGGAVGLARYADGKVTPLRFRGDQNEQLCGPELLRVGGAFALAHSDGRALRVVRLDQAGRRTASTRLAARKIAAAALGADDDARVAVALARGGGVEVALLAPDGSVERRVRLR